MKKIIAFLSLFSSFGTIICCALPALMVSLGLGATLASFLSSYPQIIWLSENKAKVFIFAGLMLIIGAFFQTKAVSCPVDSELASVCKETKVMGKVIYFLSLFLYLVGIFFAYLLPIIF